MIYFKKQAIYSSPTLHLSFRLSLDVRDIIRLYHSIGQLRLHLFHYFLFMKSKKLMLTAGLAGTMLTLGLVASGMGTVFAQTANQNNATLRAQAIRPIEAMMQNVQRSVQNIANGVTITLTSTDAATVTKLQKVPANPQPKNVPAGLTITHTNITNGVQITITSTDAATVTKIQEDAKNGRGPGFGFGHGGMGPGHGFGGMRPGHDGLGIFDQNVVRNIENISNGVKMTMTSTDAATVTKLQTTKEPAKKDDNVTVTKKNLSNGIEITMTSTDAATVTKLQQGPGIGKMGHHGRGSMMNNAQTFSGTQQ